MGISQFLQFLRFWPRTRQRYFTQGFADGKAAALSSGIALPADSGRVGEQALLAAGVLPGGMRALVRHLHEQQTNAWPMNWSTRTTR